MLCRVGNENLQSLPVIDMGGLGDPGGKAAVSGQSDYALSRIGFCYFKNIGVSAALVDGLFEQSRRLHTQPAGAKVALGMNDFHRGYMPPKTSLTTISSVVKVTQPNDSESLLRYDVIVGPNAMDKCPAYTKLSAVARAGHLPTALKPPASRS